MDTMKRKQFLKGISQLSEEGAIQVFTQPDIGRQELIVGVVGMLQFDVLAFRLKSEYGAELRMERLPFRFVRWVPGVQDMAAPEPHEHDAEGGGRRRAAGAAFREHMVHHLGRGPQQGTEAE